MVTSVAMCVYVYGVCACVCIYDNESLCVKCELQQLWIGDSEKTEDGTKNDYK